MTKNILLEYIQWLNNSSGVQLVLYKLAINFLLIGISLNIIVRIQKATYFTTLELIINRGILKPLKH